MGDKLDNCVIKEPIGKGGFAEVYLAECKVGEVALKLYTDPSLDYEDFFNEVKSMGLFGHKPYFVNFLGSSSIRSPFRYILMEYMKGGNLRNRERRERITVDEALWVTYLVSYALRDMHDIGMVHRDVAPDNIFFDENRNPKLGDLGFATTQEQMRNLPFKKYYTAPEIFEGKDYSPSSDIYSLGVTLYEMLGGDPRRGNAEEAIQDLKLPGYLAKNLQGMCSADPNERPSASKLIKDRFSQISPHFFTTYTATEIAKSGGFDIVKILTKSFFDQERERTCLATWEEKKEEVFNGLTSDLQAFILRAYYFGMLPHLGRIVKRPNCYLGLEHLLWGLLEKDTVLDSILSKYEVPTEELRQEIFTYLCRVEYHPAQEVISPRLERILQKAKKRFPHGVGEREFITLLFEEESFFSHLLRWKGLDPEKIGKRYTDEI